MTDIIILGTDTDAGKTSFCALWMSQFHDGYEYWKPLESGVSDTKTLKNLVPAATCHEPLYRFSQAVAPPLAARSEAIVIPRAKDLASRKPATTESGKNLVIETYGGPFSPLNENQLQIDLLCQWQLPCILVSSSTLGAIGRSLQCLEALHQYRLEVAAIVLMGEPDAYAEEQVGKYSKDVPVYSIRNPGTWTANGIQKAAKQQESILGQIQRALVSKAFEKQDFSDLLRGDNTNIWHPYTPLKSEESPLLVEKVEDEYFHLAGGRRIIDGISSWWTILFGHRHPLLMNALANAMRQYDHVLFAGVTHEPAIQLAEYLLESAPWPGGRVFYSDNGSTAVEVALKMAYQFWCQRGEPHRQLFIGFQNGYHGDTFGAMAASRDPLFFGVFEPLLFQTKVIPLDPDHLKTTLKDNAGKVSGVILEPMVQGAGGMRMQTPEILKALFEITREQNVLFLADEVMTANRLGTTWAFEQAAIAPDLICAAKTLTGGVLPLAVTLASPRIVQAFDTDERVNTFFHGHSFTAHPLACAVAVANWHSIRPRALARTPFIEKIWHEQLLPLQSLANVREVRISGSIAAVELEETGGYLAQVGKQLKAKSLEKDVFLRPLGNVLYTLPPLGSSESSLRQIAEAIRYAVTSLK